MKAGINERTGPSDIVHVSIGLVPTVQTVRKSLIKDFFSMMKYSLFATKNEKLISDLNEAFVENNPCFGKSIANHRIKYFAYERGIHIIARYASKLMNKTRCQFLK